MREPSGTRYYLAVVFSGVSVAGWIGAVLLGFYTLYLSFAGGPVERYGTLMLAAVVVGVVFAVLEKRLYRRDSSRS